MSSLAKSFALDTSEVERISEALTVANQGAIAIGDVLGEAVHAAGATQTHVSKVSGVGTSRIAAILGGAVPTVEEAAGLATWMLKGFDPETGAPKVKGSKPARKKKRQAKLASVPDAQEPDDEDPDDLEDWDEE